MEGRSPTHRPSFGLAFLVPIAAGATVIQSGPASLGAGPVLVLGLCAGGAWQALHRRDLADRLTLAAAAFVIGSLVALAAGTAVDLGDDAAGLVLYVGSVVAGLVLAERVLRRRDRRSTGFTAGEEAEPIPGSSRPSP